ncbi:hypothetical protein L1887_59433 [Cichorium endivia]|nr:hypothetical protein L1887_59433 [Cichorium endivia]
MWHKSSAGSLWTPSRGLGSRCGGTAWPVAFIGEICSWPVCVMVEYEATAECVRVSACGPARHFGGVSDISDPQRTSGRCAVTAQSCAVWIMLLEHQSAIWGGTDRHRYSHGSTEPHRESASRFRQCGS